MVGQPIFRRYSKPNAGTVDVQELATDDITGLTFTQLSVPNTIIDMFTDPAPAASKRYTIELFKNSISTGRNFFSTAMDTSSAGRTAVGPVQIRAGQVQYGVTQTAGTAATTSFVVKYAGGL